MTNDLKPSADYPIIITQDSREQKPLKFTQDYIGKPYISKLDFGDYSASHHGVECDVFFERKALGDLFGTLTSGNERFRKEVARCFAAGKKMVILVEVPLEKIYAGYKFSRVSGKSVGRTLFSLFHKYDLHFHCATNKQSAALYVAEFYYSYFKNLEFLDERKKD